MSTTFAIKDLYFHGQQSRSYLFTVSITIMGWTLFLNLTRAIGILTVPSNDYLFSRTIIELFTQFNQILVVLLAIFLGMFILTQNHAIIQYRISDMATMRALGTYPRQVYSFYIKELWILLGLSWFIGVIGGYIFYFIIYLILESQQVPVQWNPDKGLIWLFCILMFILTYMINGWEIRKKGSKTYSELERESIHKQNKKNKQIRIKHHRNSKLSKFLLKWKISTGITYRNLTRKKHFNRQMLFAISLASGIFFLSIFGTITVGQSINHYVKEAQGENVIVIGAKNIVYNYSAQYATFSQKNYPTLQELQETSIDNTNLENNQIEQQNSITTNIENENTGQYGTLDWNPWQSFQPQNQKSIFSTYLLPKYNLTDSVDSLSEYLEKSGFNGLNFDARLITQVLIKEEKGYHIVQGETADDTTYLEVGLGNRSRYAPIQGINMNTTFQHWIYEGDIGLNESGAIIGDSIAADLFEIPYLQHLSFVNPITNKSNRFQIYATIIDSFDNGNGVYVPINDLQQRLERPNYTNLILLDYSKIKLNTTSTIGNIGEERKLIMEILNKWILNNLGDDFTAIDLTQLFEQNIEILNTPQWIMGGLSLGMAVFIILALTGYQRSRLMEDKKDFRVMKLLGASKKFIHSVIFQTQGYLLTIGLMIGFIFSMFIVPMLLLDIGILPSLTLIFSIYFIVNILFIVFAWFEAFFWKKTIWKKENIII